MLPQALGDSLPATASAKRRSPFIVSAWYDWVFFLAPPLAAMLVGYTVDAAELGRTWFRWWGQDVTPGGLIMGVFIHAHLVIVFWRSHGNKAVRQQFPARFFAVPVVLLIAMNLSLWVAICASVLATFWDVYHSGAQTFGFARIYEAKAGNDATAGRWRDFILNQVLYAGPIVAGATMLDHFEDFREFETVEAAFFTAIPAQMESSQSYFTWAILGSGALFLVYYAWASWRSHRAGNRVPWQKVFLLVSTGAVSIYSWGFNPWGEAFLIMNLFHGLQYFGIVWAMEGRNIQRLFRLDEVPAGRWLTLCAFLLLAVLYGLSVEAWAGTTWRWWTVTIVVSLMHFWFDGFIWSVRKPAA